MINLTEKELQVIHHIRHGLADREIAKQVYVSEKKVSNMVSRLLSRCGCRNRAALVAYAYENNILINTVNTTSTKTG